jgi:Tfp pilus assembly protein PilO
MMKLFLKLSQFNMQKIFIFGAMAGAFYYLTLFDDGAIIDANLNSTNQQIVEEEKKKQESEAALKEEEQIRALVKQLSEQYRVVSAQIPTEVQPFEILRIIDSMAETSGVSVRSKEPRKPEVKEIVEEIPIRIVAEGRFTELTLFLYNLVNTERISRLLTLSMAPAPNSVKAPDGSSSKLVLDLTLANYRFIADSTHQDEKK